MAAKHRRGSLMSLVSSEGASSDQHDEDLSTQSDDSDIVDEAILDANRREKTRLMQDIQAQFVELSSVANNLFDQQLSELAQKIDDVRSGKDETYRLQATELSVQLKERVQSAKAREQFRLQSIEEEYQQMIRLEKTHMEEAKSRAKLKTFGKILNELNATIGQHFSEPLMILQSHSQMSNYFKRQLDNSSTTMMTLEPRKKPVSVSFPYVVYNLHDNEINDDLAVIQRACMIQNLMSGEKATDENGPVEQDDLRDNCTDENDEDEEEEDEDEEEEDDDEMVECD